MEVREVARLLSMVEKLPGVHRTTVAHVMMNITSIIRILSSNFFVLMIYCQSFFCSLSNYTASRIKTNVHNTTLVSHSLLLFRKFFTECQEVKQKKRGCRFTYIRYQYCSHEFISMSELS